MTDIQAAVGREQLKRLPELVHQRRELAARYKVRARQTFPACLEVPSEPEWARTNWQSYCVRLPMGFGSTRRDAGARRTRESALAANH